MLNFIHNKHSSPSYYLINTFFMVYSINDVYVRAAIDAFVASLILIARADAFQGFKLPAKPKS